jgi:hypothetical protein
MIVLNPVFELPMSLSNTALAIFMMGVGQIWLALQLKKIKGGYD